MSDWNAFNWDVVNKIPHFTGALSMLGSGYIILDILRNRQKLQNPYGRIMLALSSFDFLSSLWFFVGEWAQYVAQTDGWTKTGKPGTIATCEASGLFIYLGSVTIPLYNAALSIQYYLSIRHSWSEKRIAKSFERYAHAFIIIFGLTLAIIPLPLDLYNPWYSYCYITAAIYDPDTDSYERGTELAADVFQIICWVVVYLSALVVTIMNACIYLRVSQLNRNSNNQSFVMQRSKDNSQASQSATDAIQRKCRQLERETRSKNNSVLIMALLYTIPFYLTWVVPSSIMIRQQIAWMGKNFFEFSVRTSYASNVYIAVAMPLQGFFNWFVYMFPRISKWKRDHQSCCPILSSLRRGCRRGDEGKSTEHHQLELVDEERVGAGEDIESQANNESLPRSDGQASRKATMETMAAVSDQSLTDGGAGNSVDE